MANTEGNRKIIAKLKEQHGVDAEGKSIFHKKLGQKGKGPKEGHFNKLKAENPDELRRITRKGALASNKVQGKDGSKGASAPREDEITGVSNR